MTLAVRSFTHGHHRPAWCIDVRTRTAALTHPEPAATEDLRRALALKRSAR